MKIATIILVIGYILISWASWQLGKIAGQEIGKRQGTYVVHVSKEGSSE